MNSFIPHNLLVTGGAGFIGSYFIRYLLQRHKHVRVVNLDALTYAGCLANLKELSDPDRHIFVQGNICDRSLVDRLLREWEIETLVHFAAESHVDRSVTGPDVFVQTNVVGTFTLIEAARAFWLEEKKWQPSACRFHHISTDEVFGSLGPSDSPFCENTPYAPNSPYAASKAAADHVVRAYHHTYGLPTTTTNCSNNYGPFQHSEKFIPTVIHSCLAQEPIPVYGNGSNIRDWLYVEDHCAAITAAITRGRLGESYNVGGCTTWTNLDTVHLICRTLAELTGEPEVEFTRLIRFVRDRPGHDWRYAIDTNKIQTELNWHPRESFTSGIRKTVAWYLQLFLSSDQLPVLASSHEA